MNTSRERWSSSGQASRCTGGWTRAARSSTSSGPVAADVEQPLDAEDVLRRVPGAASSARCRTRSSRAPRRGRARTRLDVVRVLVPLGSRVRQSREVALRRREEPLRLDVAEGDAERRRGRVERARAPARARRTSAGVGQVRPSSRRACPRPRPASTDSGAAEPVHAVDRRDDRVERVVVRHDRVREQRVHDRRRVGDPGRLDHDAPERRDLARVAAVEQVAQLVRRGRRAARSRRSRSRAAPSARRRGAADGGRSRPRRARSRSPPSRRAPGCASSARDEGRLAAAEEARDEDDRASSRAESRDERRVERVERPAGEPLGLHPERAEVGDDGRAALAVAEDVARRPSRRRDSPKCAEHAVEQRGAEDARAPPVTAARPSARFDMTPQSEHIRVAL